MALQNTAIRLAPEMLDRLDAYAETLRAVEPTGRVITRSDAARVLLARALDGAGVVAARGARR